MARDTEDHRVPTWLWLVGAAAIILALASIDGQPDTSDYVGVCNRPTVNQAC